MRLRFPIAAGSFYPSEKEELNRVIDEFLEKAHVEISEAPLAIVSPHAGYVFCGKVMAHVYKALSYAKDIETAIILGPNHYGRGLISTCTGIWKLPNAELLTDDNFITVLMEKLPLEDNPEHHAWEHSIEVQLPWIARILGEKIKIVPISVNPAIFEKEEMISLGKAIYEACKELDKKVVVIASSDFTHYGAAYNYIPFTGSPSEILEKIKQTDMDLIEAIQELDTEKIIEIGSKSTVCGYGCIAAMVEYAKLTGAKEAKLLDYTTSFDVSKTTDAIVAYAGVVVV